MCHDDSETPTPPKKVDPEEELARSVVREQDVTRRTEKRENQPDEVIVKIKFRAFDPPRNKERPDEKLKDISVDRIGYLKTSKAIELGEQRAKTRGPGSIFIGWAVIMADDASQCGRAVVSSPSVEDDNPAHADIELPAGTVTDPDVRKDHLVALSERCCWRERSGSEVNSRDAQVKD